MSVLIPAQRSDGSLLWIPERIAEQIGAKRGEKLSEEQREHSELAALARSREEAAKAGVKTDRAWHKKNGFA